MKVVSLDGARLTERESAFQLLEEALSLPVWWGRNLDALFDCLTGFGHSVQLILFHSDAMSETEFGYRLLRVLKDASERNQVVLQVLPGALPLDPASFFLKEKRSKKEL